MRNALRTLTLAAILIACAGPEPKSDGPPSVGQITGYLARHLFTSLTEQNEMVVGDFEFYKEEDIIASAKGVAAVAPHRRLRIEISGLLGQTVWVAVSDGRELWLVDMQKKTCQHMALEQAILQMHDQHIDVPISLLIDLVSSYPQQLASRNAPWRLLKSPRPPHVFWAQLPYVMEFENAGASEPLTMETTVNGQTFWQKIESWLPFDRDHVFPRRWSLYKDEALRASLWTWKWNDPDVKPLRAETFERPKTSFCP